MRICAEIREELEPEEMPLPAGMAEAAAAEPAVAAIAGAVYVQLLRPRRAALRRAVGELAIVRRALGEVPLVGFFAAGEIARHHVYGYTGVLTVFTGTR